MKVNIRCCHCLLLVFLTISWGLKAATISGWVQDRMEGEYLDDALVLLQERSTSEFDRTAVTDDQGFFRFERVLSGIYHIEIKRDGYYSNVLFDLDIRSEREYHFNIRLLRKGDDSDREYCFMLGGIEVCSDHRDIIPEEMVTTRRIDAGEIEHLQATSLGDVIRLIPGIEKSSRPGLSQISRVAIRSVSAPVTNLDPLESYGTTILVDGDRLTNEANVTSQRFFNSAAGIYGTDLRSIPADNIESVEVISGIPSVEYGNFANGIIKVETKRGVTTPKLKVKFNPDTKGASFTHGFNLGSALYDYHLNYAYSERDLRETGDEYRRLHISGAYTQPLFGNRLESRLSGRITKTFDDEAPSGVYNLIDYDHGYRAAGNLSLTYRKAPADQWKIFLGMNLDRKQAYREKWVADPLYIPADREVEYHGQILSDTLLSGYIGRLRERGKEWVFRGRLQRNYRTGRKGISHSIMYGIEYDLQRNAGKGLVLDPVFNYYGLYSTRRSYPYDEYPCLQQWSIYGEDVLNGTVFGKQYALMLGLRYEVFNPTDITSPGKMLSARTLLQSEHGEFLCPRLNWHYFFSDDFRIRGGIGRSARAVSLGYMFLTPAYFKFQRDSIVVEERQIQHYPDLQTYATDKVEVSIDWRPVDRIGLSLTGYYLESHDRPVSVLYPWGYEQNPDTITAASYHVYRNRGWYTSGGVEFVLRTRRHNHFQHRLNVTYRFSKNGQAGLIYDRSPDLSWEETWYPPPWNWREKVIIDYSINYISIRLGVWVTLEIQHIPLEHKKSVYTSASGYKVIDDKEFRFHQGMNVWFENALYDTGGRWLFNFRITKSLSSKTEISLYVNNIFDYRARWQDFDGQYEELHPPIYYGLEASTQW